MATAAMQNVNQQALINALLAAQGTPTGLPTGVPQGIPPGIQTGPGNMPIGQLMSAAAKNQSVFRLPFMFIAVALGTLILIISIIMMIFMDNKVPGVILFFLALIIAAAGIAFYVVPSILNKENQGGIFNLLQDATTAKTS